MATEEAKKVETESPAPPATPPQESPEIPPVTVEEKTVVPTTVEESHEPEKTPVSVES